MEEPCRIVLEGRESPSDILLPYGEGPDGRMLHISEVPSGLACGCKCPGCSECLVARKGQLREHHFAHKSGAACATAVETALHRLAKQVIAEHRKVWLPAVEATVGMEHRVRYEAQMFEDIDVTLEEWMIRLRPDIVARKADRELLIEVAVTHFCDDAKLAIIRERRLPAIEIDLRRVPRDAPKDVIEKAILVSAERRWLFNARQEDLVAEMVAERDRKAELAATRKEKAVRAAVARLMNAWNAAPDRGQVTKAREAVAGKLAEIADAKLTHAVGHDVGGDRCFVVDRQTWQAAILHHVVNPKGADPPVRVADVLKSLKANGLVKAGLSGFVEEEVSDTARGEDIEFMSPYESVEEYLGFLEAQSILRYRLDGFWVADRKAVEDARVAVKNARSSRERVADVRKLVESLLSDMEGLRRVDPAAWMKTLHEGLEATPEVLAARSPWDFDRLINHLRRLGGMLRGTGDVEEDLLGLPLEGARERRRVVIAAAAEAARVEEEQRRAADAKMRRQRAEARRNDMIARACGVLGADEGKRFATKPLVCLRGRALVGVDGLDEEQEYAVQTALGKEFARLQAVWARERKAEECCQRLAKEALSAFGPEKGALWMKAGHPALFGKRPQEVAVDEAGLSRCLALLTARGRKRR